MNFLSIDYFIVIEEERSFSKAAERLHITQQTLSAHIANLERELGNKLFIRHVPLELTYAGKTFYNYAKDIQLKQSDMIKELQDISQKNKGIIKVGVGFSRGRSIMPSAINAFLRKYPGYSVQINEASNEVLKEQLRNGDIDIAIGIFSENLPGIILQHFYEEEIVLVIAKQLMKNVYHKQYESVKRAFLNYEFSELKKCPFVIGQPEDITRNVSRSFFQTYGIVPIIKSQSRNIDTLLAMSKLGIGACFCPRSMLRDATKLNDNNKKDYEMEVLRLQECSNYPISFAILSKGYCSLAVKDFILCAETEMCDCQKEH